MKHANFKPMLATISDDVPAGESWTFEPKYDGIRVLAYCTPGEVRLVTRNNLDKSRQFPEVTTALRRLAAATRRPLVLDGEIIAMSGRKPARFQELQGRMHLGRSDEIERLAAERPVSIAVFDILLDGEKEVLIREPWGIRRQRLERRIGSRVSDIVLLAPSRKGNGKEMLEKARAAGWEGLIAKRTDSLYEAGVRSRSWLKLKAQHQQEFVVGGWTEPRLSREHIGAILLGYFDKDGKLVYAGHTGGGFSFASLADMYRRLRPLERETSPFTTTPRTNERAHWVEPRVVVEVRFNEWTAEGKLRQPVFLGAREDKPAASVVREPESVQEEQGPRPRPRPRPRSRRAGNSAARKATKRAAGKRPAAKRASARRAARKPAAAGRARKRA